MSNRNIQMWDDVQALKEQFKQLESAVIRLMEQINLMQQQRKPGRKPKHETD